MKAYISPNDTWNNIIRYILQLFFPNTIEFLSKWDTAKFVWKSTNKGFDQYERIEAEKGFFNHLYNNHILTTKDGLHKTLQKHNKLYCMPQTWILEPKMPRSKFIEKLQHDKQYILKPPDMYEGKGIHFADTADEIQTKAPNGRWIVQEVLPSKLLQAKKFDLRVYVFVSMDACVYVSNLIRVRLQKYKYNPNRHSTLLTNISQGNRDYIFWETEITSLDFNWVYKNVKDLLQTVFTKRIINEMKNGYARTFEIFGVDIHIDSNDKFYILEINQNPELSSQKRKIHTKMYKALIEMFSILFNKQGRKNLSYWEKIDRYQEPK